MSIFQIKEWWATAVGNKEEFDTRSICIGNVDNSNPAINKIVVGSFEGFLRIYKPQRAPYSIEDLLVEQDLKQGILQVEAGKFTSFNNCALAVLHSRKLVVFTVEMQQNIMTLKQVYEHQFNRNAFNFCSGAFGKSNKELLCVQSVDGTLFFLESESFLFKVQLPDFVIPGPFVYASAIDSIVIANSCLEIEAYRFASLNAYANQTEKRIQPDWVCNVGEQTSQIFYHKNVNTKKFDIVALGDQSLFVVSEGGSLRFQKRLDYTPSAFKCYHLQPGQDITNDPDRDIAKLSTGVPDSPCFSYLVGSYSNYIMVYKDVQLVWTAKTTSAPVYLNTALFGGTNGLIVTLSDDGWLQVSYLGTDPPDTHGLVPDPHAEKETNYEEMDLEHQRLLSRIMAHENDVKAEPEDKLGIGTQVFPLECSPEYVDDPEGVLARDDNGAPIRVKVKVSLSFAGPSVNNLVMNVLTPDNVMASEKMIKEEKPRFGSTPVVMQLQLYALNNRFPISNEVTLTVSYSVSRKDGSELRTAVHSFQLPMAFMCRVILPSNLRQVEHKTMISTNKDAPQISSLFEDVIETWNARSASTNPNAMSFMFHNNVITSILISKNAGRYRVQCSHFEGQWYIMKELVERLGELFEGMSGNDSLVISFEDPVPLNELFATIERHFELRQQIEKGTKLLEDRTYQFRVV